MTKAPFDIFSVKATGVLAVDMVVACIQFYRKRRRALKTIYLSPRLYGQFKNWVYHNTDEETVETKKMELDGVNIEPNSRFAIKELTVDFWPEA